MQDTLHRFLSLLLAATLAVVALPLPVSAAEVSSSVSAEVEVEVEADMQTTVTTAPNGEQITSISCVNPLYQDTDVPPASDPDDAITPQSIPTYTTVKAAAAYVRSQLVKRNGKIYFNLKNSSSNSDKLFDSIMSTAFNHTGVPNEGDYLMWHWHTYGAEISYSPKKKTHYFPLEVSYYTTAAQESTVTSQSTKLLTSLKLSDKSDYQKAQAIYNWICTNVRYTSGNANKFIYHTAYSALINHDTVCQGYATLLYRLLLQAGIDCRIVAGLGGGGAHGWNIIQMGNKYYYADATWDAELKQKSLPYKYFLKGSAQFPSHKVTAIDGMDYYLTSSFQSSFPISGTSYTVPSTPSAAQIPLSNCSVTLSQSTALYTGSAIKPTVTVAYGSKKLTVNQDYTLSYKNNTAIGTATVTVTGTDKYTGAITKTFTILSSDSEVAPTPIEQPQTSTVTPLAAPVVKLTNTKDGVKLQWAKVSSAKSYNLYRQVGSGSWKKVTQITSTTYTDTSATSNAQKYRYIVQAVSSSTYMPSSIVTTYFVSRPTLSKVTSSKLAITTAWKSNSKASGYQIAYTLNGKTSTYTAGKSSTKHKLSKLKKKSVYTVKFRTYKTVSGVKYYSAWSTSKNVTVK